jgi:hypothetical protein
LPRIPAIFAICFPFSTSLAYAIAWSCDLLHNLLVFFAECLDLNVHTRRQIELH